MIEDLKELSSIEAEQSVIGSVILNNDLFSEVSFLTPDDFYYPEHKRIYEAMIDLSRQNLPIDIVSILDKLKGREQALYLSKLIDSVLPINAWHYAEIVKKYSLARSMYLKSYELQDSIINIDLEKAKEKAREIFTTTYSRKDAPVSELFTLEELERLTRLKRWTCDNLPTLTKKVPFMTGETIYIAGQTGIGKTQLAINLIYSFLQQGARVGYVSLEISKYQLLLRLLAWEYGDAIPLGEIDLRDPNWQKFGIGLLQQPLFNNFYFSRDLSTLNEIISWIETHSLDVCFIDYIQMISAGGETRNYELGRVAREFRRVSDKLCMVVMSQFNRKSEGDNDYDLSRLRDSGEIEQTATSIIFLRRKEKDNNTEFSYAVRKNQTYGLLSGWIDIDLLPTGKFKEVEE